MAVKLQLARARAQYVGYFSEPAFVLLGNPAPLYASLIRRLQPFGAKVESLNISLAVLAEANVTCFLGFGYVRIWLDRLEVDLRDMQGSKDIEQLIGAAWNVLADTDPNFIPKTHELTVAAWGKLEEASYSQFVSRFVSTPESLRGWAPELRFSSGRASFQVAESAVSSGDLFFRFATNLSGEGIDTTEQLMSESVLRLQAQLHAFDLEIAPGLLGQEVQTEGKG